MPGGRGAASNRRDDLRLGQLDDPLRLGSRDQGAGVRGEREPVELLEAADVGDRLALLAPGEVRLVGGRRGLADRRLGVGDDPVRSSPTVRARSSSASSRGLSEPEARRRATPIEQLRTVAMGLELVG